jgi:hypothetical protein
MSTKLRPRERDVWPIEREICIEQAPQTFDPLNRRGCPAVIDDKWRGETGQQ